RHQVALVATLRDLLHLVPRLHVEEAAPPVGLAQHRARPHRHADGRRREVAHVHRGAHGAPAGRQVRDHDRVRRIFHHGHHERSREHGDPAVAEHVGGQGGRHHLLELGGLSGGEGHGGVLFYPDRPATSNRCTYTCRMPVLLAALGALLMSLDSAINIVLPAMADAFSVEAAAIRWVIICYVLTYAFTAFAAGVLADRLGPEPVFTAGLWLCGVTFLGYLVAQSYGTVLVLRAAQGFGRGLGLMSLGLGVGLGLGPLLGGVLLEHWGWSSTFLFRAPLFLALAVVAQSQARRLGGATPGPRRRPALVDLLRLSVLRAALLAFLSNYAQFAVWLLAPFFLVGTLGLSPTVGGLVFALTPLANALVAPLGG